MSEQPTAKKIFLCFQPTDSTNQLTFAIKIFPGTQRDEIEKAIINRIGGKPEDRIIVVDNDDCDLVINENIPANTTENPYRVRLVANNEGESSEPIAKKRRSGDRQLNNKAIFSEISAIDPTPYLRPSVYEVGQILRQQLPKPIPCDWYDDVDLKGFSQPIKDEINTIICSAENSHHDWGPAVVDAIRGLSENPIGVDKGEGALSGVVQSFIKKVFVNYANNHGFSVRYDTNTACTVLSTTKSTNTATTRATQTRRDGIGYINDVPFFIQEDKKCVEKKSEAEKQLGENTGMMLSQFYDQVPFVVACSVAGPIMTFYCYKRIGQDGLPKLDVLDQKHFKFNLAEQLDRLRVFKVLVNIIRFFHGCSKNKLYPIQPDINLTRTERPHNVYVNLRGDTKTGGVVFVKTFEQFNDYPVTNPVNLLKLFDILCAKSPNKTGSTTRRQSIKPIRHTYKNFNYGKYKGNVVVESKYCQSDCLEKIETPRDVKKLLIHVAEALEDLHGHGFVHRDIRHNNIIFDETAETENIDDPQKMERGEFLLIDFDHSDKAGERLKVEHTGHPPFLQTRDNNDQLPRYNKEHDIYNLGMLIDNLQDKIGNHIFPESFKTLGEKLKNEYQSIQLKKFVKDLKKLII